MPGSFDRLGIRGCHYVEEDNGIPFLGFLVTSVLSFHCYPRPALHGSYRPLPGITFRTPPNGSETSP